MKITIECHPVGSERFYCDGDMIIYKVVIDHFIYWPSDRDPNPPVKHSMKIVESVDVPPQMVKYFEENPTTRKERAWLMWNDAPFERIFENIEDCKAQREIHIADIRRSFK